LVRWRGLLCHCLQAWVNHQSTWPNALAYWLELQLDFLTILPWNQLVLATWWRCEVWSHAESSQFHCPLGDMSIGIPIVEYIRQWEISDH
jgi:hypothetical protein